MADSSTDTTTNGATEPMKTDETAAVAEKVDQTTEQLKTDSKTEELKTDDSKTEDSKSEDSKTEDSKTEDSKTEDSKTEDSKAEDSKAEDSKGAMEESKTEANIESTKEVNTEPKVCSPELEKKIIRQIEFYFGDNNLSRDKFLQGVIKEDEGWVKLDVLLTFNRLKNLSEDKAVIMAAMEKSSTGLMQLHEDREKLRRHPDKPLPEFNQNRREDLKARSVYAKGFGLESTLEQLEDFFLPHGTVEYIQMRRDAGKKFKGSVFVVFAQPDAAQKFVSAENMKFGDVELIRFLKDDYFKHKAEERKSQKEKNLKEKEDNKEQREDEEKEAFRDRITKGSVVKLDGLPNGLTVDELRTTFNKFGEVAWVEYQKGDPEARVRFANENEGYQALEKAKKEGEIKINDTEVKAHVLEGDDEINFWKSLFQEHKERKGRSRFGKRGRGGRGSGPPSYQ